MAISENKTASAQKNKTKKLTRKMIWIMVIVSTIGIGFWLTRLNLASPEKEMITRSGLHWHSQLLIHVGEGVVEIPPNIGIFGTIHQPLHTHSEDNKQGIIHMEFPGLVKRDDLRLGRFFKNWGKDIDSFGSLTKMTVNGENNEALKEYVMRDGDIIELFYN